MTEVVDDYLAFARAVEEGIVFSRQWNKRSPVLRQTAGRLTLLIGRALTGRFSEATADCERVLRHTTSLLKDVEFLSFVTSARSRMASNREAAAHALREMRAVVALADGGPVNADLSKFTALSDKQIDSTLKALEQLGSATEPTEVARLVAAQVDSRIIALHGMIVLNLAKRRTAATSPIGGPVQNPSSTLVNAFRDSLRRHAQQLVDPVRPSWFSEVAISLAAFELAWIEQLAPAVVELGRKAAPTRQGGVGSLADATAAALSYDNARRGLAYVGAAYSLLLAWSSGDSRAMTRWSRAVSLPLVSDVLDLPRTTVRDVLDGNVAVGADVEVAGLVTFVLVERVGGRNRTIIRLDDQLTIYLPFGAIGRFGVVPGVWCQARGTLLAEGKGGFNPPLVRVRRRRLGEASRSNFSDFMEYEGRQFFTRFRGGGWDLTAGRGAYAEGTANEIIDASR